MSACERASAGAGVSLGEARGRDVERGGEQSRRGASRRRTVQPRRADAARRAVGALDYQFPLKSVQANKGVGKIDLLGLREDGTLAVVELKIEDSVEDLYVALLEGLIYAAVVEANIAAIADEFRTARGHESGLGRPHVLIIAPPAYWSNARLHPDIDVFSRLAQATASAVDTRILLCRLEDADDLELGLAGRPPRVRGQALHHKDDGLSDHAAAISHRFDVLRAVQTIPISQPRRARFADQLIAVPVIARRIPCSCIS